MPPRPGDRLLHQPPQFGALLFTPDVGRALGEHRGDGGRPALPCCARGPPVGASARGSPSCGSGRGPGARCLRRGPRTARTVSETRIWPPVALAMMRAAALTARRRGRRPAGRPRRCSSRCGRGRGPPAVERGCPRRGGAGCRRRSRPRSGRDEGDHEAVAHGLDLVAAVLADLGAHEVCLRLQEGVGGLVAAGRPQVGRLFDVSEEQGDGAFGKLLDQELPPLLVPPVYRQRAFVSQALAVLRNVRRTVIRLLKRWQVRRQEPNCFMKSSKIGAG